MKRIISILFVLIFALGSIACTKMDEPAAAAANTAAADTSAAGTATEKASSVTIDPTFYAVSLGWSQNTSGQRQMKGFKDKFAEYGITNYEIATAEYDANLQSEQIRALISKGPVAMFITPSNPASISEAVKEAAAAGIKIFMSDGYIPGVDVVSTVMFDNYKCGVTTMTALCNALQAKYGTTDEIKIAAVWLSANLSWHQRDLGALDVLAMAKYSNIKIAGEWDWDATGTVQVGEGIDSILNSDPNKEIKAIWCAWDGAAMTGIDKTSAVADRQETMFVGCDGGEDCWKYMLKYPNQFIMTAGENIITMPYTLVDYAMKDMNMVPYLNLVQGYAVTSKMIQDVDSIRDLKPTGSDLTAWQILTDYDLPGYIDLLNQVLTENGLTPAWVPVI